MRIVFYFPPSHMDVALPFVCEVSRLAELHVLLQVHPNAWQTSLFDIPPQALPSGILPAGPILGTFPREMQTCWKDVASFNLVVYGGATSFHPASWSASGEAKRFIHDLRPDVIHLEAASGRIVWALLGWGGIPLVLTIHDPEPHSGENSRRKRLVRRLTFAQAERFILHNRTQAPLFCARYGIPADRVDVIPLGVNYLFRHWIDGSVTEDGRTVLFFGRLSPYKGLEVLYQAAPLVCEELPGVRFVVAGQPIPGYRLPLAPPLPNGGRFETSGGYLSNTKLARLFQEATVVVCPYTDATQSAVVLTAYAFGKPVVATRVGGLPEYVSDGQTGILVPPGSPTALAEALVGLLRRLSAQPGLSQHFGQEILRRGNTDLAWDRIAQQTLETYERAYARRNR